jgi:hypothetical protein
LLNFVAYFCVLPVTVTNAQCILTYKIYNPEKLERRNFPARQCKAKAVVLALVMGFEDLGVHLMHCLTTLAKFASRAAAV